jgi:hypothetical protein
MCWRVISAELLRRFAPVSRMARFTNNDRQLMSGRPPGRRFDAPRAGESDIPAFPLRVHVVMP